jgi:iron-sulfur cluster repair protein YtfE (RIC family)
MDPIQTLKQQHRKVEDLFEQVDKTTDGATRRALLDQIAESLELHMQLEEEVFYPAVRQADARDAQQQVDEAFEEHHVVKLVLAELPQVDPADDRFEAKMTVLSELIEHHVKEEEKEMFKIARKLGKQQLKAIGEEMRGLMGEASAEGEGEEDEEGEEELDEARAIAGEGPQGRRVRR